jgi:hypothetical protein
MELYVLQRIAKDYLDVVLFVVAAYAVAAWLVFDRFNNPMTDEFDNVAPVDTDDLHRQREIVELMEQRNDATIGSDVVTAAERLTAPLSEGDRAMLDYHEWRSQQVYRMVGLL